MSNEYENSMSINNGKSLIKNSDIKKHISSMYKNKDIYLNCEGVKYVFNNCFEIINHTIEDFKSSLAKKIDDIIKHNAVSESHIQQICDAQGEGCKAAFRLQSILELIKEDKDFKDVPREKTDIRHMLTQYVDCAKNVILASYGGKLVFRNNVRKNVYAYVNYNEFGIVLSNLVINAFTHSRAVNNTVEIILNSVDDKVAVSVMDYGRGIDPVAIRNIMDIKVEMLLQNLQNKRVYKGCGLIVCQKLAGYMNANIAVLNQPGAGAMFTIMIDAAPEPSDIGRYVLSDYITQEMDTNKTMLYIAFGGLAAYRKEETDNTEDGTDIKGIKDIKQITDTEEKTEIIGTIDMTD